MSAFTRKRVVGRFHGFASRRRVGRGTREGTRRRRFFRALGASSSDVLHRALAPKDPRAGRPPVLHDGRAPGYPPPGRDRGVSSGREKLVREGDAGAPAMLIVLRGSLEVMMKAHEPPGEAVRGGEGGGGGKDGGYGPRSSLSRRRLRDAPILRASRRSYAGGASPRSGSRVAASLRRDVTHARVGVVPEGGTFGENAAVCGGARSRTAVCGERDTVALVVAGDALGWAIRRRPVLADELARALAWRRAWNDFGRNERGRGEGDGSGGKGGKKKGEGKEGAAFVKPTARDVAALADTIAKTHRAAGGA